MVKEEQIEDENSSPTTKEEALDRVIKHPDVSDFIDKETERKAEEKARRMLMIRSIQEITDEKLNNDLPTYRDLESENFNSIISHREKILHDIKSATEEDMQKLIQKNNLAYKTESSFNVQRHNQNNVVKPINNVPSSSLPEDLSEVDRNASKYSHALMEGSKTHFLTNDPHKTFDPYEKHDLVTAVSGDCREATNAWRNEFAQSRARNLKYINRIEIK